MQGIKFVAYIATTLFSVDFAITLQPLGIYKVDLRLPAPQLKLHKILMLVDLVDA